MKKIDLKEYKKACAYYDKTLALTDKVLYELCRKHPKHDKEDSIHAKLWIIGRTYASGIERLGKSKGVQGSVLSTVQDCLHSNRKVVNDILTRLSTVFEPLTSKKVEVIVKEHGRFVGLLSKKLRQKKSARSFASKYLHFHNSAIPIFDSYAEVSLRKLCLWKQGFEVFEWSKGMDECYYAFVLRFLQLYQHLEKRSNRVNVKLLDNYLSWRTW